MPLADFGYNEHGNINFIQFKHESIGGQHSYYKCAYYKSGKVSKWQNYDAYMTLLGSEEYSYNTDGLIDIVLIQDEDGDLTSYWLHEYDAQGEKTSIIGIGHPGIIKYKYYAALKSEDGQAYKWRYIYDYNDQFSERIYYTILKKTANQMVKNRSLNLKRKTAN